MIRKTLMGNKERFLEYNEIRKGLFTEYSPRDSELILYLLPWLLSVNRPECPGYIQGEGNVFTVCHVETDKEIKRREDQFKDMFGITERGSLLIPKGEYPIEGVYSIGSVGTISQTFDSDCDIWVCYDLAKIGLDMVIPLKRKLQLIKNWYARNCRIPVHFFPLDRDDIMNCRFGSVDDQSSGSTQTHVLKEEFYRTCVVICGRIPLWWVCYDTRKKHTYEDFLAETASHAMWSDIFIDMGNLENVEESEYFGAALWQLNKALEKPLKSIIKMLLLKMQLDALNEELVCHKFRQHIMIKKYENMIPDPSVVSMIFIMSYYQGRHDQATIMFIKECFYLRCGMKAYSVIHPSRKQLGDIFVNQVAIDRSTRERLDRFAAWDLESQIAFGKQLFTLLIHIYRDIAKTHSGVATLIDREDLTVIGRKIQAFYEEKDHKVSVLPRVMDKLNTSGLTFHLESDMWHVHSGVAKGGHLVSHADILYAITFIVKNDLFDPVRTHMLPNSSSVSLPEIQQVAVKIRDFIHLSSSGNRRDYLKKEVVTRMLVVVSFEDEAWEKSTTNLGVIYKTSWGDVYVRRFHSERRFKEFIQKSGCRDNRVPVDVYLQKRCINYPVILAQVKGLIKD